MKIRTVFIAPGILLFFLVLFLITNDYQQRRSDFIERRLAVLQTRVEATGRTLSNFSRYVFEETVNRTAVLALMKEAATADEQTRTTIRARRVACFRGLRTSPEIQFPPVSLSTARQYELSPHAQPGQSEMTSPGYAKQSASSMKLRNRSWPLNREEYIMPTDSCIRSSLTESTTARWSCHSP